MEDVDEDRRHEPPNPREPIEIPDASELQNRHAAAAAADDDDDDVATKSQQLLAMSPSISSQRDIQVSAASVRRECLLCCRRLTDSGIQQSTVDSVLSSYGHTYSVVWNNIHKCQSVIKGKNVNSER